MVICSWNSTRRPKLTRTFDLSVAFYKVDRRLRPGFTAHITLVGQAEKNVLYVPRVAIFENNGKPSFTSSMVMILSCAT